jgi:pimeloyl-ACP methyl ester carboxylesterase
MNHWQSGFVSPRGFKQRYTRTGGDHPALVLAHGFSDDGLCWSSLAQALESEWDVVMVDARGHGYSELPDDGSGVGPVEQADDLAAAIKALGLARPCVVGHSMGAITALMLAARYPDLPRAIVLEDPPPWWNAPPLATVFDENWKAEVRAWLTGMRSAPRENALARVRKESPNWPEVDLGPWADAKLRFNMGFLDRPRPAEIDWPQTLGRVRAPTLLVASDPSKGGLVGVDDAARLRVLVPHTVVKRIADAGHSIHRDQSAAFLAEITQFFVLAGAADA